MALKIALAGNPNCGKTTLFNALTGANQFVGNWPGVTVEKKEGKLKGHSDVVIMDLPGIYSLSQMCIRDSYITNDMEHQYLDASLGASVVGTHSLSSVLLIPQESGAGLNVETHNINYCTKMCIRDRPWKAVSLIFIRSTLPADGCWC